MNEHIIHALDAEGTAGPKPTGPAAPLEGDQEQKATHSETTEEAIEWDVRIETPPPRPTQTLIIRFVEGGKRPIRIEGFEDS